MTISRNDLLGTSMTMAKVGAAIISNERADEDAPRVVKHLRGMDSAVEHLTQALAESVVAQDLHFGEYSALEIDVMVGTTYQRIMGAINR